MVAGPGESGGGQQRRVLAQDRRLERLELGARVDAQLVAEALLGLGVRRQRVDLSARAVERQHQLSAQPLVEGVGGDQLLQPPHHLAVLPEGEGGGHGGLLGDDAQLPEPGDGGVGEVRRSEVAQDDLAAPEGEGLAQQRGGVGGVADPERLLAAVHETGEDLRVEVGRVQRQPVAAGPGRERVPGPGGRQHPTYGAHVGPQRGRGAVGGGLAPERRHEVLAAEQAVGVEQQQGQQLPGPRPAQRHRTPVGVRHQEWPQQAEAR